MRGIVFTRLEFLYEVAPEHLHVDDGDLDLFPGDVGIVWIVADPGGYKPGARDVVFWRLMVGELSGVVFRLYLKEPTLVIVNTAYNVVPNRSEDYPDSWT